MVQPAALPPGDLGTILSMSTREAPSRQQEAHSHVNTRTRTLRRTAAQTPPRQAALQSPQATRDQTLRRTNTQIPPRIDLPRQTDREQRKEGLKSELLTHKDEIIELQTNVTAADKAISRANRALSLFMARALTLLHMYPDTHPGRIIPDVKKTRKDLEHDLKAKQAAIKDVRAELMGLVVLMLEKKENLRGMCEDIEFAQFMEEMRPEVGQNLMSEGVADLREGDMSWL
jgi:hypothetical protein